MKKRILFVIDSLSLAGAEKSLVTLLSLFDYTKYSVDLLLFKRGGEFEAFLPQEVNILPLLELDSFNEKSLVDKIKSFNFNILVSKLLYRIRIIGGLKNAREQARKFWTSFSGCIESLSIEYDVAIAYAQRIPTFFVVDKVTAKKKIGWINVDYALEGEDKTYQQRFYEALDGIVLVSKSALDIFAAVYPEYEEKMHLIYDINDATFIKKMAKMPISEVPHFETDKPTIITVARLVREQKGYDISLEAARILKERGLDFRWYAIGSGPYRKEMELYIEQNDLKDCFIFLGTTANPYRYMSRATLYVQTSRHEGFGLSIAEARILNIPVVTTEFNAVYNQMVQGKNGIVVPINALDVADAIEDLLQHPEKREAISCYQQSEKKGNAEELEKVYALIES